MGESALQLKCPSCAAPLQADDIQLDRGVANCRYCHALMSFGGNGRRSHSERAEPPAGPRLKVPMPPRFSIDDWGSSFTISYRWFHGIYVFLACFAAAWDAFIIFWVVMAVGMGAWFMAVFALGHIAVGIGLTYATLAGFLNRTTVAVDGRELSVRHGPVPWAGNVTLDTSEVEQLYCQEQVHTGKHGSRHFTYNVHVATRDGRKLKLLSNFQDADQALFVEQALEDHLKITDRPVAGEMSRS